MLWKINQLAESRTVCYGEVRIEHSKLKLNVAMSREGMKKMAAAEVPPGSPFQMELDVQWKLYS